MEEGEGGAAREKRLGRESRRTGYSRNIFVIIWGWGMVDLLY